MSPRTTGSPPPHRYPRPPCARIASTTADGAPPPEQPTQSSDSSLTLNPVETLTKVRDIPADRRQRIRHRQVPALRVLPQLRPPRIRRLRITRNRIPRPRKLPPRVLRVLNQWADITLDEVRHVRDDPVRLRHSDP